ncbi:HYR-like domain-containing protein [Flavobacterium urocaniciphilum]|uniref:Por secretion system C-terminal sorting domain-containing protein n=1 Tax=Flavobacterium urocaniciphilum TaxID=1299341 RepID=A0A1H8ZL44_9FLAO|nr:T9SS type A sorting domain-containing protein [Flavobacterium urocaniciphilum]SEP64997.1 Por secretion system C-terminal sorting domain-containing protein [Flavobacterium urocaniciphilum]
MNVIYNLRIKYLGLIFLFSLFTFSYGQSLTSDKDDYYPGELATFTGSGFAPNETIELVVLHSDETPNTGENHEHWEVQADSSGTFVTTWIVCTDDCLGSTLRAYATGLSSGFQAWVDFKDANSSINLTSPTNAFQGDTVNVVAKLTSNPGNVLVIGRVIKFYLNGVLLGQSSTNSSAEASFSFICSQAVGNYNGSNGIKAEFEGDPSNNPYAGSSKANNFEIKAPICMSPTITCPQNITVSSEINSCGKLVSFQATATGTSPTISYKIGTITITSPYLFPKGTSSVTATATNSCGSSNCVFTVTVNDTTPPILTSTGSNQTISCSNQLEFNIPTAIDNCDTNPQIIEVSDITTPGNCNNTYTRVKTWKAQDASGNQSATVSQTINVIDDIDPVPPAAPATATYQCLDDVPAAESLSAQDNCSGVIVGISQDTVDSSNPCHVVITRTWTFTDACQNSSSVVQTINVIDDVDPVPPAAPAAASYQCLNDVPAAESLSAQDNCSGVIFGISQDSVNSSNPCHVVITRTWTFTDACQNSSSVVQTINVIDDVDPVPPAAPATASYQCLNDVPAAESLSAQDNCSGMIVGISQDTVDSSNPCHVVITRTWTFTDACQNSSSVVQTINVIDDVDPVPPAAPATASYQCLNDVPAAESLSAQDNCSGVIVGISQDTVDSSNPCHVVITRTWTFTDACQNSSSVVQTINVIDDVDPVPPAAPAAASYQCLNDVPAAESLSAQDNCSGVIVGISQDSVDASNPCHVVITRTWTFTDACQNSSSVIQIINVIDDVDPVPPSAPATASYQCLNDVPAAESLSAQDNCSGVIAGISQDSVDSSNPCHVVITRTWTFTDACQNSSSVVQTINVIDDVDPVPPAAPAAASYQCLNDVPAAESLSAQDNCSGVIVGISQDSVDASNPCHVVITRTWTFTDACQNSSSVVQTINVIDDVDPVPPAGPATASYQCLDDVPAAESLSAQDNCSGVIVGISQDTVDASNPCHVVITRTWTFTDACQNSSSVVQTINVIDTSSPSFSKPADITIYTNSSCGYNANVSVTGDVFNESDNCSTGLEATYSDSTADGVCQGSKIITRTWSLVDNCGNHAAIQTQIITVLDNSAPSFSKPADITIYTNSSCGYNANVSITGDVINESDNCSTGLEAAYSDSTADGVCQGSKIITRTWSLVDNCGNHAANQTQIITVLDNTPPTISCPLNKTNLITDTGVCTKTLTAAQIGYPTFNDNCSIPDISFVRSDNKNSLTDSFSLGITTITWTATDKCNNQTSCNQTIEVNKIQPSIVVSTNVNSQQYSDLVTFSAQLTTCTDYSICGTVTFKLGTTVLGIANVNSSGLAELPNIPMLFAPNSYTITAEYSGCSSYLSASSASNLIITCEDALAYYTGSTYVSTSSATSSNATVTLSATIKDISAETNSDINFGNITNAKVTFVNRDNNNAIIAANVPIGLVNAGDTKVGTATYNWNTSISGDSQTITIGIIVTGYYCRNSSDENALVTISKPLGDLFITGGGYLTLANSSGIKAGTIGTKNNYGFNVKYNKNKTSLQGNINTIIRRIENDGLHVYQVKGNSMTSLSVTTNCPKKAVFVGKANIQDITNPLNVIAVDGNATLQVTMTDYGEPGNNDQIAITVWNKNGGLWYASNWNGTTTVEQKIGGGNLKVHGGQVCDTSSLITKIMSDEIIIEESIKPEFKIWPNPSANEFNLDISNKIENEPTLIEVFDQSGRLIQKFKTDNEQFQFGTNLKSGMYFIQITNGTFKETKQIIKQ